MTTPEKTLEQRLAEKRETRTGACASLFCSDRCTAYEYVGVDDGFHTCACGHTQWSHKIGA